jgi:uncharacterized protein YneR
MEIAKEKGCVNVQWQTPVFNEKAIRFYERIGGKALDKKRFSIGIHEQEQHKCKSRLAL